MPARPTIDSHRRLAAERSTIIEALTQSADGGRLLLANASLAFRDAGVELSPSIADHVLHTVRQSAAARTRRERLTAQLKEALGATPHPSDPSWLATTIFTTLRLAPLATAGHEAAYQPAIPSEVESRLRSHLPPTSRPRLPARGSSSPPKITWRLDLDAPVPRLEKAPIAPEHLSLDELWFYLDSHSLVRPLLELGILEVSVLPTLTREQYEAVRAGKATGGFLDWVDSVTFPAQPIHPRRQGGAPAAAKKTTTKKTSIKETSTEKTTAKKTS